MKTLLFEIGTEELPARFLSLGLAQLAQKAEELFKAARIEHGPIQTYGTPRRMAIMVDLAAQQKRQATEARGPAVRVAFDEAGNPTKAALGFARGQGVAVEDLEKRETDSGVYLYAVKELPGESTEKILPELLPKLLESLSFPQTMRWGDRTERFARPVRWLVALWGTEVVDFTWAGVASSRFSSGHRFWSTGTLRFEHAQDYLDKLRANYVLADPVARRKEIEEGLLTKAQELGGKVLLDQELLDEVNNLVEYPTVFAGSFPESYLELPREAIITPMRDHQRYFPLVNENGELLNAFLAVRDGTAENLEAVARGNERVLLARLEDAKFYYETDRQVPLGERVEKLKEIVYHEKLGSLLEKTRRLEKLVLWLSDKLTVPAEAREAASRAATLAKADLTTSMVGEFTELQGIMGREYALASGETQQVAVAIAEQYLPRFSGDALPQTLPGKLLAIADKVDSVVGCFRAGLIPTGSEDPYALRRAALGALSILLDSDLSLELVDLLKYAETLYGKPEKTQSLKEFFWGRLKGILHEVGWQHSLTSAVLAAPSSDVVSLKKRGEAIEGFMAAPEFGNLLVAYNRAANLAQKGTTSTVEEKLLVEEAEKQLWTAFCRIKEEANEALSREDWQAALASLSRLREPLDAFFDGVLVMAKEEEVRINRLAILRSITELFSSIADFKALEV